VRYIIGRRSHPQLTISTFVEREREQYITVQLRPRIWPHGRILRTPGGGAETEWRRRWSIATPMAGATDDHTLPKLNCECRRIPSGRSELILRSVMLLLILATTPLAGP